MDKKLIILLIISILTITPTVKAEDIFGNITKISYEQTEDPIYNSIKLNDGYLIREQYTTWEETTTHTTLKKITTTGEIIWEKEYQNEQWTAGENCDVILSNDNNAIITCAVTGTKKIDITTGETIIEKNDLYGYRISKFNDKYLVVGNETLVMYSSNKNKTKGLYILDENLNIINQHKDETLYYDAAYADNENNKIYAITTDKKNYSLFTFNSSLEIETEQNITLTDYSYFARSGSIKFTKIGNDFYYLGQSITKINSDGIATIHITSNYGDGMDYTSIEKINNYIVLGGLNNTDGLLEAIIEIYDLNWNLLQTINVNNEYEYTNGTENISLVKNISPTTNGFIAAGIINEEKAFSNEYSIKYKIETKTDGNGTVTSSKTEAFNNEEITFITTPNEGYKLDKITITDKDGKAITYTNNTFTMPSNDVIIEATFVKETIIENILTNPPTGDITIPLIILFFISILIIYKSRKAIKQ